jgi:glycine/D-amino acid oxidase-like deaminating enzyme
MDRRTVLIGFGACAVSGIRSVGARPRPLRVGVVGAGILGASIAVHLVEAGAEVTVFEAAGPASGATRNSYAWLNAFVDDPHYRDVRLASLAHWRRIDARYGLGITWGGYLNWGTDSASCRSVELNAAQLADSVAQSQSIGLEELLALAPYLTPGPVCAALWTPSDGHLDPQSVTERLVAVVRERGAHWHCPSTVEALDFRHGRLTGVNTSAGRCPLDRLVIAAGTATPALAALAGTPLSLQHAPGILAHTRPLDPFTRRTHEGPRETSFKQLPNGRVVAYDAPHPPDLAVHEAIRAAPTDFPSDALRREHGQRMLDHVAQYCPRLSSAELERVTLGFRPLPPDDRPIVGALRSAPDVHVAVTHSGVTLAAILGRWISTEIIDGTREPALAPYRPERFA